MNITKAFLLPNLANKRYAHCKVEKRIYHGSSFARGNLHLTQNIGSSILIGVLQTLRQERHTVKVLPVSDFSYHHGSRSVPSDEDCGQ